jgi:type IV fimbrial biogenesis protein FimT
LLELKAREETMNNDHRIDIRQRGFTLVELLAVLTVFSIVLAVAAPSLSSFSSSQRLRGASTDLVTTLLAARSEAIKRNTEVTVSADVASGSANWGRGWTATAAGGLQIDRKEVASGHIDGSAAPAAIVFDGSGRITIAGGASIQLRDGRGDTVVSPRCVSIDLSGRPQASVGACS